MEEKDRVSEERHLIQIESAPLEEFQLQEQLYNSAGLDPVVDAGIRDYDKRLQRENKLINKVLGPRDSDVKSYGVAVAKRVAFAVYTMLNRQYGGKVGDLRSYIMALQDERDRANAKYDELLGRTVGILGEEYRDLRADSRTFMERLTTVMGEDLKESRIDQKALAESLADIDGLRSQVKTLENEKEQLKEKLESQLVTLREKFESQISALKEKHESQISALTDKHGKESDDFKAQITKQDATINTLASEKTTLTSNLVHLGEEAGKLRALASEQVATIKAMESEKALLNNDLAHRNADLDRVKTTVSTLSEEVPPVEIGKGLEEELYSFLLQDSRVPHMVIDGVGKFIDFKKYLGLAAAKGADKANNQAEKVLRNALGR